MIPRSADVEPTQGTVAQVAPGGPLAEGGDALEVWFEGRRFGFVDGPERDTLQAHMARTGRFYEEMELVALRSLLPTAPFIVDVGTNLGNHAVFFERVCGARRVVVFEAQASLLPELAANLRLNGCTRVEGTWLGAAVGAREGRARLEWRDADRAIRNRGGMRLVPDPSGEVAILRLDSLPLAGLDVLKIDVEGMALDVLEGAEGLFAGGDRPILFVELECAQLPRFRTWCERWGYVLRAATTMYGGLVNCLCQVPDGPHAGTLPAQWPPLGEEGEPTAAALLLSPEQLAEAQGVLDPQSEVAAAEILPMLWSLYGEERRHATLLDVGCRTGAGSELLRRLHRPGSYSRLTLDVVSQDIRPLYAEYSAWRFPELARTHADIAAMELIATFDIVICSHTIQRTDDPVAYLDQLRGLARNWVLMSAPSMEELKAVSGDIALSSSFLRDTKPVNFDFSASRIGKNSRNLHARHRSMQSGALDHNPIDG